MRSSLGVVCLVAAAACGTEKAPADLGVWVDGGDLATSPADLAGADLALAGGPDGGDTLAPSPPSGSTLCASGAFSGADAATACAATSSIVEPARCDAAAMTGGVWQIWCASGGGAYLWVRFDGVTSTDAYPGCMGIEPSVLNGWADVRRGAQPSVNVALTARFAHGSHQLSARYAASFVLDGTAAGFAPTDMAATSADVFASGQFVDSCAMPLQPVAAIIAGAAPAW